MASNKLNPAVYRVFLSRHFIDVLWLDIKADSALKAKNKAEKMARALRNRDQSRAVATDNGWIADEPVIVAQPGSHGGGVHEMEELGDTGVFIDKYDRPKVTYSVRPKSGKGRGRSGATGLGGVR